MTWISTLAETYDACLKIDGLIGSTQKFSKKDSKGKEYIEQSRPLLPIHHESVKADYIVKITADGNFVGVEPIAADDRQTITPCTLASRARSGVKAYQVPHLLADKLPYITARVIRGEDKNFYLDQLSDWVNSESFKNAPLKKKEAVLAVYEYVAKESLLDDFRKALPDAFDKGVPDCFLRWYVIGLQYQIGNPDLSKNEEIWSLYIDYVNEQHSQAPQKLCYASGEMAVPLAWTTAPRYILRPGDSGKIICNTPVKPGTGYWTNRGRFFWSPEESCVLSDIITQKSTAMLRYLVDTQGWTLTSKSNLIFIVWNKTNPDLPIRVRSLCEDDIWKGAETDYDLGGQNAEALKKSSLGEAQFHLMGADDKIEFLMIDSPSQGRVSVVLEKEMYLSEYRDHINRWYKASMLYDGSTCSISQITRALYDKFSRKNTEKIQDRDKRALVNCINFGAPLPKYIVQLLFQRVCNIMHFFEAGLPTKDAIHNWYRAIRILSILLIITYVGNQKEEHWMDIIEQHKRNRDFLYGAALACYHQIERKALAARNPQRQKDASITHALELYQNYMQQPKRFMQKLDGLILPYYKSMPAQFKYEWSQLNSIKAKLVELGEAHQPKEISLGYDASLGFGTQLNEFSFYKKVSDEAEDVDNAESTDDMSDTI